MDHIPLPPRTPGVKPEGIKVIQVPPNNISLVQPLDQMVIKIFKAHYTQSSMERIVNTMEENSNREDIVQVWKDYVIEDAFVVIEKNHKNHQAQNNKILLEKIVQMLCMTSQDLWQRPSRKSGSCGCGKKKGGTEDKDFKMWILEKFKCQQTPHQRNSQKTTWWRWVPNSQPMPDNEEEEDEKV